MDSLPSKPSAQSSLPSASPTRQSSRPSITRQPSLLPAFEPFSSSPQQLVQKRKYDDVKEQDKYYPSPIPTSSTGILPSSPPRPPALHRTLSTLSERVPLSDLPTVILPANGDVVRFGRSSSTSDHQLPYSRHISRLHVTARYHPSSVSNASARVEVECAGWNGVKIRCAGRDYALNKGDTWVSSQPLTEIMLDVLDCRVMIQWPMKHLNGATFPHLEKSWSGAPSPCRAFTRLESEAFASSPPPMHPRSPVSPSPARLASAFPNTASLTSDPTVNTNETTVQVYEDDDSDSADATEEPVWQPTRPTNTLEQKTSFGSLSSSNLDELSDQENEENDPVVHSFGPFGSNLLSRLDSFSHTSPQQPVPLKRKAPLKEASISPKRSPGSPKRRDDAEFSKKFQESPIKNHVINQLAFSRLHSIPLTTIHTNLPAELKACVSDARVDPSETLTHLDLERVLHSTPCVGEITRQNKGKDAAGKPLENEFYYLPELDENVMRRDAVLGGRGGTGLRAVRKSHKQYYWKKPRH